MKLRTYLILSYLALIAILTAGTWFISNYVMGDFTKHTVNIANNAVKQVTAANVKHSENVLTSMGKYAVRDKAADVARELKYILRGYKHYNYGQMRRNPLIRAVALQTIYSPDGPAGHANAR